MFPFGGVQLCLHWWFVPASSGCSKPGMEDAAGILQLPLFFDSHAKEQEPLLIELKPSPPAKRRILCWVAEKVRNNQMELMILNYCISATNMDFPTSARWTVRYIHHHTISRQIRSTNGSSTGCFRQPTLIKLRLKDFPENSFLGPMLDLFWKCHK